MQAALNKTLAMPSKRGWPKSATWALVALTASLLVLVLISTLSGAMSISLAEFYDVIHGLVHGHAAGAAEIHRYVIFDIRLPRIVTACVVGAGLAAAGVCMQGLFRNPLADPSLIGVSSGASLGAVSVIVLGAGAPLFGIPDYLALPVAAFIGGLIATWVVYAVATRYGEANTYLLLLAGIAVNAIANAGVGLLSYIATDNQLRDLTFWSMGSLAKSGWRELAVAAPLIGISAFQLMRYRQALDSLLMGEAVAGHIGHDVASIKRGIIVFSTLIIGTAVSISGIIMFVGLVVPHLVRLTLGASHRYLLPLSMLAGACLLLLGDIFSRIAVAPAELPIGLLMALAGGPFFIFLLITQGQNNH